MEHFITEVRIDNVRHLKNINIALDNQRRQHLILIGKNGSGKTSVLNKIAKNLALLSRSSTGTNLLKNHRALKSFGLIPNLGLEIFYNQEDGLPRRFHKEKE